MTLNRHLRSASHSATSTSATTTATATASATSATSTTSTVSASHATATASATASSTTTAAREASSSTRSIIYKELGWTGFPIESCNGSPTETHFVTSLFPGCWSFDRERLQKKTRNTLKRHEINNSLNSLF